MIILSSSLSSSTKLKAIKKTTCVFAWIHWKNDLEKGWQNNNNKKIVKKISQFNRDEFKPQLLDALKITVTSGRLLSSSVDFNFFFLYSIFSFELILSSWFRLKSFVFFSFFASRILWLNLVVGSRRGQSLCGSFKNKTKQKTKKKQKLFLVSIFDYIGLLVVASLCNQTKKEKKNKSTYIVVCVK
jgi:hypothetical protein